MSFLFVDKILCSEPGQQISGLKHITYDDDYLIPSSSGEWALMPSIIGEALGQLGAWCVMQACDFTHRPVAGVVSAVHMHSEALVGETLLLTTYIDKWDTTAIEYHAVATVGFRKVFTIESALGPMLPMADFISRPDVIRQFEAIYRPSEQPPEIASTLLRLADFYRPAHANFDALVSFSDELVVAQKRVNAQAEYFTDHFPNKPVLPLTILLNAKLDLASRYLSLKPDLAKRQFQAVSVRKIKMSDFVQPGDIVSTSMKIKWQDETTLLFRYRSEVAGRRVCVAEAVFVSTL